MLDRFWWLWGNSPPQHNAQQDQAGRWPLAVVGWQSYRAQPTRPIAAPPGWMDAAGSYVNVGNLMSVPATFVEQLGLARQVSLPPIGPTNQDTQRARALQSALAASLSGMQQAQGRGK